ncbi:hypothetical protein ACWGKQ_28600 [Streptomyces sp. NPDC054770]
MPLTGPEVTLRAFAVARHGRLAWPPLTLVTDLLAQQASAAAAHPPHPGTSETGD